MKKALFVTFEGVEGSGKSSQIAGVYDYFTQKGLSVIRTREPGGTPLAEKIRNILICEEDEKLSTRAELLLMLASRAQHVGQLIEKNMNQADLILCDRFADSTLAYQGGGRDIDISWLQEMNRFATNRISPDVTFLMDLKIEESLNRLSHRKKRSDLSHVDRFETEGREFHEKIRQTYLNLAKQEPNRFVILNAIEKPAVILSAIVEEIQRRMMK